MDKYVVRLAIALVLLLVFGCAFIPGFASALIGWASCAFGNVTCVRIIP